MGDAGSCPRTGDRPSRERRECRVRGIGRARGRASGRAAAPASPDASSRPVADAGAGTVATTPDLERIRADVAFWGGRFAKSSLTSSARTRLAASEIELARATGDVTAYLAASTAIDGALAAYPDYALALDYRGVIHVALHQFADRPATTPRRILVEHTGRSERHRRRSATRRSSSAT